MALKNFDIYKTSTLTADFLIEVQRKVLTIELLWFLFFFKSAWLQCTTLVAIVRLHECSCFVKLQLLCLKWWKLTIKVWALEIVENSTNYTKNLHVKEYNTRKTCNFNRVFLEIYQIPGPNFILLLPSILCPIKVCSANFKCLSARVLEMRSYMYFVRLGFNIGF